MSTKAYVGIDVACAKKKRLPLCVCTSEGTRLLPLPLRGNEFEALLGMGNAMALDSSIATSFAKRVATCLGSIEKHYNVKIQAIAIDASSHPKMSGSSRRACEAAMDKKNISCFTTPSKEEFDVIIRKANTHLSEGGAHNRIPHANQIWMLIGFALFRELSKQWECLEVYPQAIIKSLGVQGAHKSKKEGLALQRDAIAAKTGWEDPEELRRTLKHCCFGSAHDTLDAFMCAWVARLPMGKKVPLGQHPTEAIWIPA